MYPGFTLLDLAGPQAVLGMHAETYLIWKTLDAVPTDSGMSLNPTHTFDQVPGDLDVLFVPGGFTANDQMADDEVLDFLTMAGSTARYITSVCSGALVLGMAGLLDGYRAATHWAVYPVLEAMGVETSPERVVIDRNRMTGGGVTFPGNEIEFTANDRLAAPRNAGTESTLRNELAGFGGRLFGGADVEVQPLGDPARLGFTLKTARAVPLDALLSGVE